MKYSFTFLILIFSMACSKEKAIIQGELADFAEETFVLHRDEQTGYLNVRGTILLDGDELIYTYWYNKFLFFDPKTGKKTGTIEIPKEGPMAIRGGSLFETQFFDQGNFILLGRLGDVQLRKGDQILKSLQLSLDTLGINLQNSLSSRKQKITQLSPSVFELSNNPFDLMSFSNRTAGFDVENFGAWTAQFDDKGDWICFSDFKGPFDESYAKTSDVGDIMRVTDDDISSILFPFSDSLYQIKNCQLTDVKALETPTPIRYAPSEEKSNGMMRTWVQPDGAGMNLFLLDDPKTGVKVRFALLEKQKGGSDFEDPRSRQYSDENQYVALLYNRDWQLNAELKIKFPAGTQFENLFIMDGHLLINKPEQSSDDEYEFYKIDLGRFGE